MRCRSAQKGLPSRLVRRPAQRPRPAPPPLATAGVTNRSRATLAPVVVRRPRCPHPFELSVPSEPARAPRRWPPPPCVASPRRPAPCLYPTRPPCRRRAGLRLRWSNPTAPPARRLPLLGHPTSPLLDELANRPRPARPAAVGPSLAIASGADEPRGPRRPGRLPLWLATPPGHRQSVASRCSAVGWPWSMT